VSLIGEAFGIPVFPQRRVIGAGAGFPGPVEHRTVERLFYSRKGFVHCQVGRHEARSVHDLSTT
jgi:hypothetical protein